jgi:hypothetical protein
VEILKVKNLIKTYGKGDMAKSDSIIEVIRGEGK